MKRGLRSFFCLIFSLFFFVYPVFSVSPTLYRHGEDAKKIALTFDDGPHVAYTGEILDILKEHSVKATFFLIGENARAHPSLVRRIASEGHEIGNHTDTHRFLREMTLPMICKEITSASVSIEEIAGMRPRVFRPPGGSYTDEKIGAISEMGYTCVLWSKDTRDWARPTVDRVVEAALKDLKGGDVILFHDFNGVGSPTPEALRRILPEIKARGFEPVTVSELLG